MLVEAAGFWAATPEEHAEVGFDSELRWSILELELADLFTEVGESTSIRLSPVGVEELFMVKLKHKMAYLASVH